MLVMNEKETHELHWLDGEDIPVAAPTAALEAARRTKAEFGDDAPLTERAAMECTIFYDEQPFYFVVEARGQERFMIHGTKLPERMMQFYQEFQKALYSNKAN